MSNEELVSLIQSGDQEKMTLLWDQVRNFVAWKAKKIMLYVEDQAYVEMDDLIQSGYLALVEAVNTYTAGTCTFIHWFHFYLQNTFADVAGYQTKKTRYEPSRSSIRLDIPIGEDGDSSLQEIMPDPNAEAAMDAIDNSIWHKQLHDAEMELLEELQEDQKEVIYRHFFLGHNCEMCDEEIGLRPGRSRCLLKSGLDILRKPLNKHKLRSFLEFDYFRGTGLSTFRNTGMSIQERYLVRTERRWKQ